MFGIFFTWLRRSVKDAVFAGLADAAAELEAEAQKNSVAVEEFRTRAIALTDKSKKK